MISTMRVANLLCNGEELSVEFKRFLQEEGGG